MKSVFKRFSAAVVLVPVVCWGLYPAAIRLWKREAELAIEQLEGRGCQIREGGVYSVNPLARMSTRQPALRCPMYAAEYIAQRLRGANSRRAEALRAFDRALAGNPAVFDTGDGVIQFGAEIAKSREAFLAGNPE